MNGYCEIFIYKECEILKDKNFKVDNINDYLLTRGTLNEIDIATQLPIAIQGQWMKHSLKMKYNIVIPINAQVNDFTRGQGQASLSFNDAYNYNYLVAQNCDNFKLGVHWATRKTTKVYYFIVGKKWLSENSLELELEMDVINTLIDNDSIGGAGQSLLTFSPKTTILRQHKDRWGKMTGEWEYNDFYPKIDLYSENILPILYKKKEHYYRDLIHMATSEAPAIYDDGSYYLIYRARTTDVNSPIDVLLCSDEEMTFTFGATGFTGEVSFNRAMSLSGNVLIIYGADSVSGHSNVGSTFTFTIWHNRHSSEEITLTINNSNECIYWKEKRIAKGIITENGFVVQTAYTYKAFSGATFDKGFFTNLRKARRTRTAQSTSNFEASLTPSYITNLEVWPGAEQEGTYIVQPIRTINRTDPLLLKIIALPYRPVDLSIRDGVVDALPLGWAIENIQDFGTFLRYVDGDLTKCFQSVLDLVATDEYNIFTPLGRKIINLPPNFQLKNIELETKLLHSDFFLTKLIYDSFTFDLVFENYEFKGDIDVNRSGLFVKFYVTATMNSKFMFRFYNLDFAGGDDEFSVANYGLVRDTQNYSNILYVARNNELPLFNSAFLNYIRTGYNYDVKTKNRQLASNLVGVGFALAGTAVTAFSATATGPIGIAGAIGLGLSSFQKMASAVFQTAQAEQNIAQKLKIAEMQGLSVIGSDDVDLMTEYTKGNKLKYAIYEVSPKMKQCLFDLFYYCGYVANIQGVPDTTSRKWFNFVQADVIFNYEQNFPQELLTELKNKFREGVTYLHCVVVNNQKYWNFDQTYENWETSVLHYLETGGNNQ